MRGTEARHRRPIEAPESHEESTVKRLCPNGHTYSGAKCGQCRKAPQRSDNNYDHKWNMLSKRYRAIHPLCEDCEKRDRTTPASEVHHIVPITKDPSLRLVWSNLVALCHGCHVQRHRDMGDQK